MKKVNFQLIFLAALMLLPFFALSGQKQTAYLVCITNGKRVDPVKTLSITEVYAITETCFPGNCIDIDLQLSNAKRPVFEMYAGIRGVYIEKKLLVKIRRNGTLKLKRFKL